MLRILFLYLTKVGLQGDFVNQGRAFSRRPRWFLRAGRTWLWLDTWRTRLGGGWGGLNLLWVCLIVLAVLEGPASRVFSSPNSLMQEL
ncbi:hypothetical protein LAUMK191_05598 [Mycobacterium attenuatum]|nr:hypothetical protein LAUMK191_05598 [Mycobacterium attenuatum]